MSWLAGSSRQLGSAAGPAARAGPAIAAVAARTVARVAKTAGVRGLRTIAPLGCEQGRTAPDGIMVALAITAARTFTWYDAHGENLKSGRSAADESAVLYA